MKIESNDIFVNQTYEYYFGIKKIISSIANIALKSFSRRTEAEPARTSETQIIQSYTSKQDGKELGKTSSFKNRSSRCLNITKIDILKNKQHEHLLKLTALAQAGQWCHLQMHTDHPDSGFDWWMFPIDRASTGYGDQYRVNQSDIEILIKDPVFMKNYRNGVILVVKAWGWDLEDQKDATNNVQKWTNYQVRLGKMLDSLRLFKQEDLRIAITKFVDQKGISASLEPWIQQLLYRSTVAQP